MMIERRVYREGRMHGDARAARPREQLAAMLEHFVALNWIRQAILVAAFIAALHALGLLYRSEHLTADVPAGPFS